MQPNRLLILAIHYSFSIQNLKSKSKSNQIHSVRPDSKSSIESQIQYWIGSVDGPILGIYPEKIAPPEAEEKNRQTSIKRLISNRKIRLDFNQYEKKWVFDTVVNWTENQYGKSKFDAPKIKILDRNSFCEQKRQMILILNSFISKRRRKKNLDLKI